MEMGPVFEEVIDVLDIGEKQIICNNDYRTHG